jgi:hypothetical protein
MFEAKIDEAGPLVPFLIQQFGVCIASLFWGLVTIDFVGSLATKTNGTAIEALVLILLGLGPACIAGILANSLPRRFVDPGCWIWLLPTGYALLMQGVALASGHFGEGLSELFCPPDDGEAFLGVWGFTYPWLGCLGYSLGIAIDRRWTKRRLTSSDGR